MVLTCFNQVCFQFKMKLENKIMRNVNVSKVKTTHVCMRICAISYGFYTCMCINLNGA